MGWVGEAARPSPGPQLLAPFRAAQVHLQERHVLGEAGQGRVSKEQGALRPTCWLLVTCPGFISPSSHLTGYRLQEGHTTKAAWKD